MRFVARLFGRNTLPPIGEVFAEVCREETQRQLVLGKKFTCATGPMEVSTMDILEA